MRSFSTFPVFSFWRPLFFFPFFFLEPCYRSGDPSWSVSRGVVHDPSWSVSRGMVYGTSWSVSRGVVHDLSRSVSHGVVHDPSWSVSRCVVHEPSLSVSLSVVHEPSRSVSSGVVYDSSWSVSRGVVHEPSWSVSLGVVRLVSTIIYSRQNKNAMNGYGLTNKLSAYRRWAHLHTQKGSKNAYLFWHGHAVCKFSGKSPLSSHNMTLEQKING